jgi:hypothetical protein
MKPSEIMAKSKDTAEAEAIAALTQEEPEEPDIGDGGDTNIVDDDMILAAIVEESVYVRGQANHHVFRKKENGRIVTLSLGTAFAAPYDHHLDLSPAIHQLDALESLTLTSCKSLPQDMVKLRSLRKLTLIGCKRLDTFPPTMKHMDQLRELRILGIIPMIPPYILEQIACLSDLQVLQFSFHSQNEEEELFYLQALASPGLRFAPSLRELNLNRCHISNDGFRFLLSRVVPNFPNLKVLSLCQNSINSFQGIASLTEDSGAHGRRGHQRDGLELPSLEQLIVSENPIWSASEESIVASNERDILALLLKNNAPRLTYIGYRFERSCLRSPQVQHWLDVNRCGRWLIDRGTTLQGPSQHHSTGRVGAPVVEVARDIDGCPIAVWAILLSRANMYFTQNTNSVGDEMDTSKGRLLAERQSSTIYYLLRHGPALVGRTFT